MARPTPPTASLPTLDPPAGDPRTEDLRPDDLRPEDVRPSVAFHGVVTASPEMEALFRLLQRAARTEAPVLIRGETGTGKELVARAVHALSPRARGPMRTINCATLTPELLASELFGHVKGAFTGAVRSRPGLFQLVHGGTLFLDEVAEIPLDIQARLLRVLEDQTFVPVGGSEPVRTDVRIVSATHTALRREVEHGRFRRDLMHRIRVVPLFLPSLRERGDVDVLTWHFVQELNAQNGRHVKGIAPDAMAALRAYDWPGNVRELRNVLQYAFAVGEGPRLRLEDLPPELRREPPPGEGPPPRPAEDEDRERLVRALAQAGGNRSKAAEILGVHRSTLWRKLREHRIV